MTNKTSKIDQSEQEFLLHFEDQLQFIQKSCCEFDKGDVSEAKRIALHIRVLLHDNRSISLLSRLNIKKKFLYLNSASPFNPKNAMPYMGLLSVRFSSMTCIYEASLDMGPPIKKVWQEFDAWWGESLILTDQKQNKFTRRDLILNMADTDGGAHVDGSLLKSYAELTRQNSLNICLVTKKSGVLQDSIPVKYVEHACVRQIAYELLRSIEEYKKRI